MKRRSVNTRFSGAGRLVLPAVLACALILLFAACSTKKNTAASRNWQAFTTRYNVYYNGSEHYKETLKEMEKSYEDDYTRTLLTHPAEAYEDKKMPQPTGDFKRTIEKMQKAIQLHSIKKKPKRRNGSAKEKAFRNRDEFNPFLHNAWLMMGDAQYLKGDFLGSASTFYYIAKHFKWLPDVVTEAKLRQARAYCALDWLYEADNILSKIDQKQLTTKKLRNLYNLVMSSWCVRSGLNREATVYLQKAAAAASGSQKNRLYFLLGQTYSALGEKKNAYQAYKKAGAGASTNYRAKFNARIKQSEVFEGQNIRSEVKSLRAMTRYERNKEYLDQIYYAIGNLYLSRKDTAEAVANYRLAVEKSTRAGIDKALANLALGAILFQQGDYVKAQKCYSEAMPLLPDNLPDYKLIKKRSDVLDQLAVYAGNVQLQDSLLELSKLPREEQMKICEKLAADLVKKEKEEAEAAKQEEYLADQAAKGDNGLTKKDNAPTQFQINADKSWYFYNPTSVSSGKMEFQKKWGARKLEDDWNRRNKNSFAFEEPAADAAEGEEADEGTEAKEEKSDEEKTEAEQENDPHFAAYYLKSIPSTDEEIASCNEIIQEGLYNMGLILKDKLDDYPAARVEFNRLLTRYPDNIYRLDVYYNLYLMAVREENTAEAEKYRLLIVSDFPDSSYGVAMKDPDYFARLRRMNAEQEAIYEEAYAAYLADNNKKVHELTAQMEADYPLSELMPKFVFIDALSYVTENDRDKFKERLTHLLDKWPDADMKDVASGMMRGLQAGKGIHAGATNSRGILWETKLGSDSITKAADGQPANFERDPSKPQYLVLAFPLDSVSQNQLLFDVAKFNFSTFVTKDFDLEPMNFGNVGLLIISGFANQKELDHYRSVAGRKGALDLPAAVRPIPISKANFELLLREGRSFEEYFRFEGEDAVEAKEEEVLGPGLTMPSPDNPGEPAEETPALPAEEEAPPAEDTPAEKAVPSEETPAAPAEETPAEEQAP